jgi:GTPase
MKKKTQPETLKKSGMVALIGRSNVGKSTLLNALIGSKIAIVSPKPQTTRHIIHGVLHDDRGQIVFVDTPGIFQHAPDRLTARLNEKVRESLGGIDAVVYVVDGTRHVGEEEKIVHRLVTAADKPKIMVFNKSDKKQPYKDEYLAWQDEFDAVIEVSALQGKSLKNLVDAVFAVLPEAMPLYPANQITNIENRFWIEEIVREKIYMETSEEVPYTTSVHVESIEERPNGMVYVQAIIMTTSPRYKKMIIGHGGTKIRDIGSAARSELEMVTGKKIYLDLEVAVEERWQERFE